MSLPPRRLPCVGAVIRDDHGRMLLVLRGHEPSQGLWSIPGGRVEPGETDQQAVLREVREETGLTVTCGPLLGAVLRPGAAGTVLEIRDYLAYLAAGSASAATPADDAVAVCWVSDREADAMQARGELAGGLLEALRSWL